MSILFALWCVGSGLYTGFLVIRKALNGVRNATSKIVVLNAKLKEETNIQSVSEGDKDV